MALDFDDYGRPFIILKKQKPEEKEKARLRALDVRNRNSNIAASKAVAEIVRKSLGWKGMHNKILPTPARDVTPNKMNVEKLMKMAGAVRTGGKGSVRRKKKAVHKINGKSLQSTLKRIGVNDIPDIEEVNIFKEDVVIQFIYPKVQASVATNTWVVSGFPQTNKLADILPQIIQQLGPDNVENLKKLSEQFQKQQPEVASDAAGSSVPEDDDDVPELVAGETFEAAAEEGEMTNFSI